MSAHQSPPYHPTLVNLRTAPLEEIDAALRHWRGWRITVWTPDEPTETPPEPAPAELPGMWEQADLIDTSDAPPPKPDPAPDPTRIPAADLDAAYHANNEALRRVQALTPGVHIPQTRTRTRPTPLANKDQARRAVWNTLKAEVARQGWDHGIEHPYLVLVGSNISPRDFEPFDMPALFAALAAPDTTPTTPDSPRIPLDAITPIPTTRTRTRPTPTQRPPAPTGTNETDFPGMVLPANADKRLTEAIRLIALANKAPDNDSAIGHTLRALAQVISTIALPRCCEGGPQWGHAWTCDTLP